MWKGRIVQFFEERRKAIVSIVGIVLMILAATLGEENPWYLAAAAVATAFGVYSVPNRPTQEAVDAETLRSLARHNLAARLRRDAGAVNWLAVMAIVVILCGLVFLIANVDIGVKGD